MTSLRIEALPAEPLAAAVAFHAVWLPKIQALLDPARDGEGDRHGAVVEGAHLAHHPGALPTPPSVSAAHCHLPTSEEDRHLTLVFAPADHTHRGWRLAAVQSLARAHTPRRINAIASDNEAAIDAATHYLAAAPGVTGQYLPLDGTGAQQSLC